MSTELYLKPSISKFLDVDELAATIKDTDVKLTFFGATKVLHYKLKNKVRVDFVVKKALGLINELLKDWNFSEEKRASIALICEKIDRYYLKIDKYYENSNIITKICYFIRWFFTFINQRKRWKDLSFKIDPKNYYTEEQYKLAFPFNALDENEDKRFKNFKLYLPPAIINIA